MISLPFDDSWKEIESALTSHRNLVLVAEPGAGKTTRLPPGLIDRGIAKGKVAVLEPRRIAARAAALRIHDERSGWRFPDDVGYTVRFDNQTSSSTKLCFFTEGLFLRMLSNDPLIPEIDTVILDEFHERSRFTDLAISALKELQALERTDLRIIVMSATIDAEKISNFLAIDEIPAPVIQVPGRTFPISISHSNIPLKLATDHHWLETTANEIRDIALRKSQRQDDILVFLPGVGEIRRLKTVFLEDRKLSETFDYLELHGSLTLDEQSQVLSRPATSRRRIILATNIAETSLTLVGVGTVIDTGLERTSQSDRLGFSSLSIQRISLASATQRSGRSGRTGPGESYRLWSKLDENSFQPFAEAELRRTDLTDTLLEVASIGIPSPRTFEWFDPPEKEKLELAIRTLKDLGAFDETERLTQIGRDMIATGLPARAARILVEGQRVKALPLAAGLAALLTEKDVLLDRDSSLSKMAGECDLHLRATLLEGGTGGLRIDRAALSVVKRVIDSLLKSKTQRLTEVWDEEVVARLLLAGFPDRVARRRQPQSAQCRLVGGKGVELHSSTSVRQSDLLFALRGDTTAAKKSGDAQITLASVLKVEWIKKYKSAEVELKTSVIFDPETRSVYGLRALHYRDLPLEAGHRDGTLSDEATALLKKEFLQRSDLIHATEPVRAFLNRLKLLKDRIPAEKSNEESLETSWQMTVDEILFGKKSFQEFFEPEGAEKLAEIWERNFSRIEPAIASEIARLAPDYFTAPTGNRFRIHYPPDRTPYVEVRLQELFGIKENPKVGGQPLTFHLLGPNYRPVQVTSDLVGFWKGSYFDVKKELRARYPKHSWPDDPMQAVAVAKGRPQKNR
jgi:ATP-dependent helicase HrpB